MQTSHWERSASGEELGAQPRTRDEIPTPALILDLDAFDANIRTMAEHCRRTGCGFRPHAKTHKCPEIARRQVEAGALGICAATVAEAEALGAAGIRGVVLTSPIVEPRKIARMLALARGDDGLMLSVGHPREVDLLGGAAAAAQLKLNVLVDVDVGDRRTGVLPGQPAVELARHVAKHSGLRVRGVQAYAGHASHVVGFEERERTSRAAIAKAVETRELLARAGFDAAILSGGSTGTYNIDSGIAGMTELQVGSYIFMDVDYRRIGARDGSPVYTDFKPSLTVRTTVVSTTHDDRVTIDAGTKAIDATVAHRPEAKGREDLVYSKGGDEFGIVTSSTRDPLPRLGDQIEFIVPHCDPNVNLYDRLYAVRGDHVEGVWAIAARRG